MTPVLGDFLRPAGEHIAAAARYGGELPVPVKRAVITELDRLVARLARYLDDLALPADFTPESTTDPAIRAALDARIALHQASASLQPAAAAALEGRADNRHPAVQHLSSANSYLAAGRDLLQTHFTTGPAGDRIGTSPWAAVITSPPVTGAVLTEFAGTARRLAAWTARLATAGSPYAGLLAVAYRALHITSRWLHTAGVSVQRAQRHDPTPPNAHRLLHAIPANIPPPRQPPCDAETIAELCAGITTTAGRLRRVTQAFATRARWSPAANSTSWRREALASAITSHASELILRTLAKRAVKLGVDPAVPRGLAAAADASAQACAAWRAVTRQWDVISTGTAPTAISPVAAELDDLVLRTGRLAYRNPGWTPRATDASAVRDPAGLAGTSTDLAAVVAAVHHAADAVGFVAIHDGRSVLAAAGDCRLYLPTRLLPEDFDIPGPYWTAPAEHKNELLGAYSAGADASLHAAIALDDLASTIGSPSVSLAAAHVSVSPPVTLPKSPHLADQRDVPHPARQLQHLLRSRQITNPDMLIRAAAIDEATRELLVQAATNSRHRNTVDQPSPWRLPRATGQAVRTAARDLPSTPPDRLGSTQVRPTEAKVSRPLKGDPAQPRARNSMTKA
jgi:hypothetical protein